MTKEPITVSEMNTFVSCQLKYYWRYVCNLSVLTPSDELRFGTAWHKAQECRNAGMAYEDALATALTMKANEISQLMAAQLSAMLAGYYWYYGAADATRTVMYSECDFAMPIRGTRKFIAAGKIDGLGQQGEELVLHEYKTTSEDISDESDYWLRLRNNHQLMQYLDAAQRKGWRINRIEYDVARKPTIRQGANVAVLDEQGNRQVVDANGNRVYKRDGQPKATADKDKGESLLTAPETLEQYSERLFADIKERPTFYFARRQVLVLAGDIERFLQTRLTFTKQLLFLRALSRKAPKPQDAWMRNCSTMTCARCEFKGPCYNGAVIGEGDVPDGFRVRGCKHEELAAGAE